jgi:hypothetical protein
MRSGAWVTRVGHAGSFRRRSECASAQLVEELPDTALSDSLATVITLNEGDDALEAASKVGNSGRAAQSVALALFVGCGDAPIETAVLSAIRCGGDTDTVAAIAAQLRAAAGEELPAGLAARESHRMPRTPASRAVTKPSQ